MNRRTASLLLLATTILGAVVFLGVQSPFFATVEPSDSLQQVVPSNPDDRSQADGINEESQHGPSKTVRSEPIPDRANVDQLLILPSPDALSSLNLWVDQYRQSMQGADWFEVYNLFAFDEDLLAATRAGENRPIRFNFSAEHEYLIRPLRIKENTGRWHLRGSIAEISNSFVSISVFDDGNISGQVYIPGRGIYLIRPTSTLPYHIVYLATGEYTPD